MNYFIARGGQQYGPYADADLQRYLAQGAIQYTDLARTEAMSEWRPLSQILQAGPPLPVNPAAAFHPAGPVPPSLHWALVLLLAMITGLFKYVWMFIQAAFIKKIDPQSKATLWYASGLVAIVGGVMVALIVAFAASYGSERLEAGNPVTVIAGLLLLLFLFGGAGLMIGGSFSIRNSMVRYYNSVEPIGLRLSSVMTFFFNTLYIQYHFSRIAKWKETGVIYPQ